MSEILMWEGSDPAFRLAGWVLREEGFTVRTLEFGQQGAPPDEAEAVVVNGTPEGDWPRSLRPLAAGRPLLHISSAADHAPSDCEADVCLHPPYTGATLVATVRRLLGR
jgi:hypothetical protein